MESKENQEMKDGVKAFIEILQNIGEEIFIVFNGLGSILAIGLSKKECEDFCNKKNIDIENICNLKEFGERCFQMGSMDRLMKNMAESQEKSASNPWINQQQYKQVYYGTSTGSTADNQGYKVISTSIYESPLYQSYTNIKNGR